MTRSDAHAGPDPAELPELDSRYAISSEIARGGLGRILSALDRRLGRVIALKQPLPERADAGPRLIDEGLITARLQHPGIVPVYDVGYGADGIPFYSMKLVQGRTLLALIEQCGSLAERLALLPNILAVADAMAYAHSEGVVHRDLKPANVLVGRYGETLLVDWGIAQQLVPRGEATSTTRPGRYARGTLSGAVVGTPAYMAPEQARGEPVDERADVYALGAMLYHLLSGATPYDGPSANAIVKQLSAAAPVPLAEHDAQIPTELLTIVEKAMTREPAKRYASAGELAADLKRFLTGQLVSAHRYTIGSLLRRWVRRHRPVVAVATVLLAVLVATTALSVSRILDARRSEVASARELALQHARTLLLSDPTAAAAWLARLPVTEDNAGLARGLAQAARARGLATHVWRGHDASIVDLAISSDGRTAVTASLDWDARLWDLERGHSQVLGGHKGIVMEVAISRDGELIASVSEDRTARLWSRSGALLAVFAGHGAIVSAVQIAPDGATVATAGHDGTVRVWDRQGRELRVLASDEPRLHYLAFSPRGDVIAASGEDGRVWLWSVDGTSRRVLGDGSRGMVTQLAFAPDGAHLASAHAGTGVQLWQVGDGTLRASLELAGGALRLCFSDDGRALYAAGAQGALRRLDLVTGESLDLPALGEGAHDLRVSADEQRIVAATDRGVAVWERPASAWRWLEGHEGSVARAALLPGGRILSAGADAALRVWPAAPSVQVLAPEAARGNALAFSADGRRLASGHANGVVQVTDLTSGTRVLRVGAGDPVEDLAFSPTGIEIAAARGPRLILARLSDGATRTLSGHTELISDLEYAPDGRTLASTSIDGEIRLWDVASGRARVLPGDGQVTQLAFSPDGQVLVSASFDGQVRAWDVASGTPRVLGRHDGRVYALAFAPDGRHVVTGGQDNAVRLWRVHGEPDGGRILASHRGRVTLVAFAPDGRSVVSGGYGIGIVVSQLDGRARRLQGHTARVYDLAFAPDGARLATSSDVDGTVRLWDLASGESQVLAGAPAQPLRVLFTRDGVRLAASGADGTVRLWRDDAPTAPAPLARWIDELTTAEIDPRAALVTR